MKLKNGFSDEYDVRFGEPTTEVVDIHGVLDFLDEVIAFCDSYEDLQEGLNDKYKFKVSRIVMTNFFERAVKQLCRKHKKDTLKELKEAIIKLGNYEIKSGKKNHPLKDSYGHLDLHLDGGRLILIYKYVDDDVLMVGFEKSSFNQILRLQDVVTHKELNSYAKKKYKASTKDADIDALFGDEDGDDEDSESEDGGLK